MHIFGITIGREKSAQPVPDFRRPLERRLERGRLDPQQDEMYLARIAVGQMRSTYTLEPGEAAGWSAGVSI